MIESVSDFDRIAGILLVFFALSSLAHAYNYANLKDQLNAIQENEVIPSAKRAEIAGNIRFISALIALEVDRTIIFLNTGNEQASINSIKRNLDLREERRLQLNELKDLYSLDKSKETQALLELERLLENADEVNRELMVQTNLATRTGANTNAVLKSIESELIPLHDELFTKTTKLVHDQTIDVENSIKAFETVQEEGFNTLTIITLASLVVLALISFILLMHFRKHHVEPAPKQSETRRL